MLIPAHVVELNEFYIPFYKPTGQQAVGRKSTGCTGIGSVHIIDIVRLTRHVHYLRHRGLHAVSHLVLGNFRIDLGILYPAVLLLVNLLQVIQYSSPIGAAYAGRIVQIKDRIFTGAELYPLMKRGQKSAAPESGVERLPAIAVTGEHHDKTGQVFVITAQAVAKPGAHAGPSRLLRAGLEEGHRRVVVDGIRMHGLDEAKLIHHFGRVGQQFAHPHAAFAVARKVKL